jgi:hypothetical protein
LREAKEELAADVAQVALQAEGLAEAEEVVGLIVDAEEGAVEAADAAVEADGVLALFLDLEEQVDGAGFLVLVSLGVLVDLEGLEVLELVEAEQAVLPELGVVDGPFIEQEFAADDFVAGDGVALELDAGDVERLAFVDVDLERDGLLLIVVDRLGNGGEVDVTKLAVGLLEILKTLLHHGSAEDLTILDGEGSAQGLGVADGLVASEGDGAQAVARALFDGHGDVDTLALVGAEGKEVQAAFVADLGLGLFHRSVGVAFVAIGEADALGVFFQLGGVEGLREEVLKDDGVRDADRLQVLHGAAQNEAAEMLVADELDVADFDGRAFLDVEVDLDGGGRDVFDVELDGGELVAVLGEHLLDDGGGAQDLGLVELALDAEGNFLLFEAVEHVGLGDRVEALVVDLADGGLFLDEDVEDDALV